MPPAGPGRGTRANVQLNGCCSELREYAERPADWLTGLATEWDKRLAAIKRIAESG